MDSIGKQTVVTVLAGHEAPADVLKLMLDKKPKQFGFTVQAKDSDDAPDLSSTRTEDIPTLEQLLELNTNARNFNLQLYFGFLDGKVNDINIQPFLCTDGNDNPYLSVMLEGVFSKYNDPAENTEELNIFNKFIYPEVENILELTEGSMEKLLKHLSSERFNNAFLEHVDHRAVLNILPLEGALIMSSKNELGETYPWGYMSQRHGYGDATQEPEKVVNTKKAGWWSKKAPEVKSEVAKPAETKTSVPEVKATTEKKETKVTALRPPSWVHTNTDVKAWYTAVHGQVPSNWKKRIPVTVVNTVPDWKDVKEFREYLTAQKVGSYPEETKTDTAKLANNQTAATGITEPKEILNKKELEAALDYVSKHLDGQSVQILDPKTMQGIESKVPTLSETLAFDATSYLNWPREAAITFFKDHPRAAAMAFFEVRDMLRPHVQITKAVKETVTDTGDKVVTTTTKKGGTTSVSSVVSSNPAPKTSGWWGKKKVA